MNIPDGALLGEKVGPETDYEGRKLGLML